jgi:hypothetical protein
MEYSIEAYRYAKGCVVVRCPSTDGRKNRAARIASNLPGSRYVNRAKGFVMKAVTAAKLEAIYASGLDCCVMTGELYKPGT